MPVEPMSWPATNFSARDGTQMKHCDSARLCSSHQSPFSLNLAAAFELQLRPAIGAGLNGELFRRVYRDRVADDAQQWQVVDRVGIEVTFFQRRPVALTGAPRRHGLAFAVAQGCDHLAGEIAVHDFQAARKIVRILASLLSVVTGLQQPVPLALVRNVSKSMAR